MKEPSVQQVALKKDWELGGNQFHQLLEWLDQGKDSAGENYLGIRRRLVHYFDRKNCRYPDELADETLNRVARRLEEESVIATDSPAHYCYIVAKFVMLEALRKQRREASLGEPGFWPSEPRLEQLSDTHTDGDELEQRLGCLERCISALDQRDRDLIVDYYHGAQHTKIENRKAMAARMRVSANALSIRACRIRNRLDRCLRQCLGARVN